MRYWFGAALALLSAASVNAQVGRDLATAMPIEGSWSYKTSPDGSEASFSDRFAMPQLWVHCARATRRITISKPATAAAPLLNVWTSSLARDVPSSFNPATGRLTIDLAPFDALLDAIASSRGRIGIAAGTQPPLVLPAWAEPARVIEDCRS